MALPVDLDYDSLAARGVHWLKLTLSEYDLDPSHARIAGCYDALEEAVIDFLHDSGSTYRLVKAYTGLVYRSLPFIGGKKVKKSTLSIVPAHDLQFVSTDSRHEHVENFVFYSPARIAFQSVAFYFLVRVAIGKELRYRLEAFERCEAFLKANHKADRMAEKMGRRIVMNKAIWPFVSPVEKEHNIVVKKKKEKTSVSKNPMLPLGRSDWFTDALDK